MNPNSYLTESRNITVISTCREDLHKSAAFSRNKCHRFYRCRVPMDKMNKICCACLSLTRELFQLYKVPDGINILYSLLQCNPDSNKEGFLQDSSSWMVCTECRAAISNIKMFRDQVSFALKQLRILTNDKFMEDTTLSHLKTHIPAANIGSDVFVDCGENNDIKKEDIFNTQECIKEDIFNTQECIKEDVINTQECIKEYIFNTQECIENNTITFKEHNSKEKNNSGNFDNTLSEEHKKMANRSDKNKSKANDDNARDENALPDDFDDGFPYDLTIENKPKKKLKKNGESKVKKKSRTKNIKTNQILCKECGKSFENKGAKWKHIQIAHREGHKCVTCGKHFSFKFNLQRHQRTHAAPAPLTPCPTCSKLVSGARLGSHARTHASRQRVACAPCRRMFVTRETYEAHLKNSIAHADGDIFRYPCQSCDKKYRSRGELRDHVAYKHDNQKQKCPVCEKYLATRRSLARHVRRAHEGVREGARDKMCDYCGRTFRDKKSLCEHIWRHTGARPLACELCPRTFRQRAALYEHKKRLHPNNHPNG